MISGRHRGDAARAGSELQHRVHRAAQFEGAGNLQVFVGEADVAGELFAQRGRFGNPERHYMCCNAFAGGANVLERDGPGGDHARQ